MAACCQKLSVYTCFRMAAGLAVAAASAGPQVDGAREVEGRAWLQAAARASRCPDFSQNPSAMDCGGPDTPLCGVLTLGTGSGSGHYHHKYPTVHGLWPETGGYGTSICKAPGDSSDPVKLWPCYKADATPGEIRDRMGFEDHEWEKHGKCAGVQDAADYFNQTCALSQAPLDVMRGARSAGMDLSDTARQLQRSGFCVWGLMTSTMEVTLSACADPHGRWHLAAVHEFKDKCGGWPASPTPPPSPTPLPSRGAGDCAVVGLSADGPDDFGVLLLADFKAGTKLYVTDDGIEADGALRRNEGIKSHTFAADVPKGTLLKLTDFADVEEGELALSTKSDQVIVFLGSPSAPEYICALSNADGWQSDADSPSSSRLAPGLVDGETAVGLPKYDSLVYVGAKTGTPASLRSAINDREQWKGDDQVRLPMPDGFTVV